MQAVIDGRPVVMVLLNSYGKYTRIADAKRVRTWLESRSRVAAL
jgi:D-alanyl-D-alanine endopeptidase (penicillin-binding protein 7)